MTRVETLEKEIAALSKEDLAAFREWFAEFDALAWDQQIAEDVRTGKLDSLMEEALREQSCG